MYVYNESGLDLYFVYVYVLCTFTFLCFWVLVLSVLGLSLKLNLLLQTFPEAPEVQVFPEKMISVIYDIYVYVSTCYSLMECPKGKLNGFRAVNVSSV